MLKFFFNRFSKVVIAMEAIGVPLFILASVRIFTAGAGIFAASIVCLVSALYLFIRLCASVRWYKDAPRWSGIELQFKKGMVPTSYIMAIFGALSLAFGSAVPLLFAALLLAVIAHVNIILLVFHRRDRDPTPANFFSSGRFLNDALEPRQEKS